MLNPAMPFYPSEFLAETALFTLEQTGMYMKLLCIAYMNGGSLTRDEISFVCGGEDKKILERLERDEEGNFYHERTAYEIKKREEFANKKRGRKKKTEGEEKKEGGNKDERFAYGEYKNVLLTDKEYNELSKKFGEDLPKKIKALDEYIEMNGKQYKNHYAVIVFWDEKNREAVEKKNSKMDPAEIKAEEFFQAALARSEAIYARHRNKNEENQKNN